MGVRLGWVGVTRRVFRRVCVGLCQLPSMRRLRGRPLVPSATPTNRRRSVPRSSPLSHTCVKRPTSSKVTFFSVLLPPRAFRARGSRRVLLAPASRPVLNANPGSLSSFLPSFLPIPSSFSSPQPSPPLSLPFTPLPLLMLYSTLGALSAVPLFSLAQAATLTTEYSGTSFFDNWTFTNAADTTTDGQVQYVPSSPPLFPPPRVSRFLTCSGGGGGLGLYRYVPQSTANADGFWVGVCEWEWTGDHCGG